MFTPRSEKDLKLAQEHAARRRAQLADPEWLAARDAELKAHEERRAQAEQAAKEAKERRRAH